MTREIDLLTVQEVARFLRVDTTTVRRWIRRGALPVITLPTHGRQRTYRIKKETMDGLLTTR